MERIVVIGCPGGGKSTFARALHERCGIPLYHLDLMYWNADKTTVPKSVFIDRLSDVLRHDRWIVDGNYSSTMEMRLAACDTVFFLDYPEEVCLDGVRARRGKPRPDMPWVEMGEDDEFILFIKSYNSKEQPRVLELLKRCKDKEVNVFRNRTEADEYLQNFEKM